MRTRRHLSYANVISTLALFVALGGGAYAVDKVNSHEIADDTIKSVDLKDGKAVRAADVKRNGLRGRQISEGTLDASGFAALAGDETGSCNPSSSTTFTNCATTTLQLRQRSRVLAIATGNEESVGGPAQASCRVRVDDRTEPLAVEPGEATTDNTSSTATNGFARTALTKNRLSRGRHEVGLACEQLAGDVRIDEPTIAAIAIASR